MLTYSIPDGTLLEMRKDALQRGLSASDEAYARYHCQHQGVEAPDKGFFRFYIATSSGRIVESRKRA